jgi:serine/threonine protein kinase
MNEAEFRQLEELFESAADLDPQQAESLITTTAATAPAVAERLRRMLRLEERDPGEGAEHPEEAPHCTIDKQTDLIDGYDIIGPIGEGGFGSVLLAVQLRGLRRMVAIKVIKRGMDSDAVVSRFELERHALASLDHPSIVTALDAGMARDGRPYVVMPVVTGMPLTEYCDERNLSLHDRLLLFGEVCRGMQHAHARGVIHRDLKPSNILVAFEEGRHRPKIIDFGLAKALSTNALSPGSLTIEGQLIGTPEYMSPEQAAEHPADVRSDVYSLGVILYELVASEPPFVATELLKDGKQSLKQMLAEQTPRSLRQRRPETPREIDWIALRCLEKEPDRRFQTVDALLADIERFLQGQNVLCGPPARLHRLRRWARGHKGAILGTVVAIVSLVLGTAASIRYAMQSAQDREHAVSVSRTLREVLTSVDPLVAQGRDTTLQQLMLGNASKSIEWESLDPAVDLEVSETFAMAYASIGRFDEADQFARRALSRIENIEGRDSCRRIDFLLMRLQLISSVVVEDPRLEDVPAIRSEIERLIDLCFPKGSRGELETRSRLAMSVPRPLADMRKLHVDLLRHLGPDDRNSILIGRHAAWTHSPTEAPKAVEVMNQYRERAVKLFGLEDPLVHSEIALEMFLRAISGTPLDEQERWASEHIPDAERVLGHLAKSVIRAQYNHANLLSRLGRHDQCFEKFEDVYERESVAFGEQTIMARWIDVSHALAALRADDWERFQLIEARMWRIEPVLPSGDSEQWIELIGLLRQRGEHPTADRWLRGLEQRAPQFLSKIR